MANLMDILAQTKPTMGRADTVPALLSEGEYVIPADVVAMIGDGNNEAGAKALDKMIDQIRQNYKGHTEKPVNNQALRGKNGNSRGTRGPGPTAGN
jgi:hypothetical protein